MIYGVQKLSLVDYPKYPAFVLFLGGCNFRCPFCHNESIVNKKDILYPLENVLEMIESRKHFINAIVVTGGEPTIYGKKLIDLLIELKKFNLKIKLDTNGSNPLLLKEILEKALVDYVAMDIKNTFKKYEQTAGAKVDHEKIKESIQLIEEHAKEYEFRMTINKSMHSLEDIKEVTTYVKRKDRFFLQPYKYNENQLVDTDFQEFSDTEIENLEQQALVGAHI